MPCQRCSDGKFKWGVNGECKFDSEQECVAANPHEQSALPRILTRSDFAGFNIIERAEASSDKIRLIKAAQQIERDEKGEIRVVISNQTRDRDKDTIAPGGWDLSSYSKNPVVLFGHDHHIPNIGIAPKTVQSNGQLVSYPQFVPAEIYPFAGTIEAMVRGGWMKGASVGFNPKTWKFNEEEKGYDFQTQELLEWSFVPVGSNPDALVGAKSAGIDLSPMKDWAERVLDEWIDHDGLYLTRGQVEKMFQIANGHKAISTTSNKIEISAVPSSRGVGEDHPRAEAGRSGPSISQREAGANAYRDWNKELRWNLRHSKAFDIKRERFKASTAEYDLVARYLDCEVKDLVENERSVPAARMGTYLTALDEGLSVFAVEDVRNFSGETESPPRYETIQLNSKQSGTFLIDGTRFLQRVTDNARIVLRVVPTYWGVRVTDFGRSLDPVAGDFMKSVNTRASEIKFLKGEAFSLSGEFLDREELKQSWDDLFLDPKNEKALKRAVALVNADGAKMENRGILLLGPPGTGKTLSGRVVMREAPGATFIWVSARDFYYAGSFGGFTESFDLARENAPSILFIEDVDNWMGERTVDLIKTEMDGLAQHRGVVTIITTNFPERLPKALIDRPGRFHDVLKFDLPTEKIRQRMLSKWLPGVEPEQIVSIAKATQGYSGAHLKELARFAEIIEKQEGIDISKAAEQALEKVKEQRELITQTQTPSYSPIREISDAFEKSLDLFKAAEALTEVIENQAEAKIAGCTLGSECPMKEGMEYCPKGKDCPMGKGKEESEAEELLEERTFIPEHDCSDWASVRSAMARILGARDPAVPSDKRRDAFNHLEADYERLEKTPPDFRFIEAQVLRHCADVYEFTGEGTVALKAQPNEPAAAIETPEEEADSVARLLKFLNQESATEKESPKPELSEEQIARVVTETFREFMTEKTGKVF